MNVTELHHTGVNADHYGKVVAARIESDLPIGGLHPFQKASKKKDSNFITGDPGDEQPEDEPTDIIHFVHEAAKPL
jgi:hypothetical protein